MAWFHKHSTRYNPTVETQSPFARARQEWDDRVGGSLSAARSWRAMAFAVTGLLVVYFVTDSWLDAQRQVKVYVVETDPTGQPGRVELLDNRYHVEKKLVAHTIRRVVEMVRSMPTDPVVERQNWETVYLYLADDATTKMNQYNASLGLSPSGRDNARTAEVTSVLERSESTFQVNWVERTYVDGALQTTQRYTGLFTFRLRAPQTEQEVFDNPLGVYITDFSWSREINPQM